MQLISSAHGIASEWTVFLHDACCMILKLQLSEFTIPLFRTSKFLQQRFAIGILKTCGWMGHLYTRDQR